MSGGSTTLWIPTPEQEAEIQLREGVQYALGHVEGMLAMAESPAPSAARLAIKQFASSFHAYLTKYGNLVPDADVKATLAALDDLLQKL